MGGITLRGNETSCINDHVDLKFQDLLSDGCPLFAAQTIWEVGCRMKNPVEFSEELQKTELAMFGFSEEFIFDIWGDIGDAKSGRMVKVAQFDEQF